MHVNLITLTPPPKKINLKQLEMLELGKVDDDDDGFF